MTTTNERSPGARHQGCEADRGRSAADDTGPGRLDDPDLLAEVFRLVNPVVEAVRTARGGRLAGVGTRQWWDASDDVKIAGLLVLSEAWCVYDPERVVRQRLRAMSGDLSGGLDWAAASRRPTLATLTARRAEPGPMARQVDREAAQRWARTGRSEDGAA